MVLGRAATLRGRKLKLIDATDRAPMMALAAAIAAGALPGPAA